MTQSKSIIAIAMQKIISTITALAIGTLGGCQIGDPGYYADIRAIGGYDASTLDARVAVRTPIELGGYPVGIFVRDKLSGNYANKQSRDHVRLNNFSVTDLNFGGSLKALVGGRSLSTIDTEHVHDSTGRIDVRAGLQYGTKLETDYGTVKLFVSPTAIIDPRAPRKSPQGEVVLTLGYVNGPFEVEAETVTIFNKVGIQKAIQRFQGFYHLEEALGIPLSIGPQVELVETRENREPTVNAGAVLRFRW